MVGAGADTDMYMLMDWNHVIAIDMRKSNKEIAVIVDASQDDFILMHPNCTSCHSFHGAVWAPDGGLVPTSTKTVHKDIDFFYMTKQLRAETEGRYWSTRACLSSDMYACADELPIFSIQEAEPYFYSLGDGYLGLSPRMLYTLYREGMVSKKVIGVHTHLWNSTEDPSTMRFGGIREDLYPRGHEMQYHSTVSKDTWELNFDQVKFHGDHITKDIRGIINPGYPFIGVPHDAFQQFVDDVISAYPVDQIACYDMDWCYFHKPCDKLMGDMPDLIFTLGQQEYNVPPKSFMYTDTELVTGFKTCHLGIVG